MKMANELENPNENGNETKTEQKIDTASLEARIKALESERDKLKQSVTNASADASGGLLLWKSGGFPVDFIPVPPL